MRNLWLPSLVAAGRRVVVPDLYGGVTVATEDEAEARAQAVLADPATPATISACADALAAGGRPWAAMGFSLGAFLACPLAARGGAAPADLVLFYGGQPPGGGTVGTRRADLHVAPDDPWFDDDERAETESGLRAAGVEVTVHLYDGCAHWFAEPGAPHHDEATAKLARDRVVTRLAAPG